MNLLQGLNTQQREAVTTTEGALLVLAGAGSGKTRVITVRIAYLIAEKGIPPHNILAVTFTNKAAGEMRERVDKNLRQLEIKLLSAPLISTFHSLCVRILRQDIEHLKEGYTRSFTIYDTDDAQKLIKTCIKDLGYDDKQLSPRITQSAISAAKNRGEDPNTYSAAQDYNNERAQAIGRVFKLYEERLQNNNALDFDDLLIKTVQLLRRSDETREKYNDRFRYILVDEYQDTNPLQFALIKFLTEKQQNLCVVGDPDQCMPAGTRVLTPAGYKNIEEIKVGEEVLSAGGHSRIISSKVINIKSKPYSEKLLEITTKKGKVLRVTPNHVLYGKLNPLVGKHFVYLMYRQDKGFRVGRSLASRSADRKNQEVVGLQVRCNQEHADKMWILRVCETKAESAYYEQLYSTRYGIPTMVFHLNGRGAMTFTQEMIDQLYAEIDTRKRVQQLFTDFYLFQDYPHFRPKTRFEANRFVLNLIKFGDRRTSGNAPWGGHRLQIGTTEVTLRPKFESAGLPCRNGRKRTWRMETARINYADAFAVAEQILSVDSRIDLQKKAMLVKGNKSFYEFPASHFHGGMSIAVYDDGQIVEDVVEKIEWSDYTGEVFDLDVENTHNYIAENVVSHNSIYRFRAADIRNILDFEEQYHNAKTIRLEQNYRSTQNILDTADAVIQNNTERKEKKLWTSQKGGDLIRYCQAFDAESEAKFVAYEIERIARREPETRFAVLYRTNSQSRVFEEALRRQRIDYNIVGGFSFYERAEVKDIIAYLKLALNPHDSIALLRVINTPPRGLGKTTLDELQYQARDYQCSVWEAISVALDPPENAVQKLNARALNSLRQFQLIIQRLGKKVAEAAKTDEPVSQVVIAAIEDTGYASALKAENNEEAESRLENLQELVNAAIDYNKQGAEGLRDFIDHAALVSDTDKFDRNATVTLMTVHAAKGLEFPVVFLVGMEDGVFPHSRSQGNPQELEEERRLAYVAITRAERLLYISHAMRRRVYGEDLAAEPSMFLNELPLDLIEDVTRGGNSWLSFAKNPSKQSNADAIRALRGENRGQQEKPRTSTYTGKTYNSTDAISEFFKNRNIGGGSPTTNAQRPTPPEQPKVQVYKQAEAPRPKPQDQSKTQSSKVEGQFLPGMHVKHAKYGKGLVLRREGTGDQVKLTISFPGFGQKKLIEKFANLEKA
jgi:DNA helicase II / ATP-dependent DNA helicase PcrA